MSFRTALIISLAAIGIFGGVGLKYQPHQTEPLFTRIAPAYLYPDPTITSGGFSTKDYNELTKLYNGKTYSQYHRNTSEVDKKEVCSKYPANCKVPHEFDHFIPLALGGADIVNNLWAEPKVQMWNGQNWGYGAKDKLENYLVLQMKSKKIAPEQAQNCLWVDWVLCYRENLGNKFGSSATEWDGEDEIIK